MRSRPVAIAALALASLVAAPLAATTATAASGSTEHRSAVPAASSARAGTAPVTVARAGTAVVVGRVAATTSAFCSSVSSWVQYGTSPGISYTVPGAGVITAVQHRANTTAGSIRAAFYGPNAVPNNRTVLAFTAPLVLTPGTVNTFPTRVPVPAGTSVGLFVQESGLNCVEPATPLGDVVAGSFQDPSVQATFIPGNTNNTQRVNLAAVWEPDADGDGFGDVSQDLCPQLASAQAACPTPDTTVTKAPKQKTSKRKATIVFSSTVAGSTFTCTVDLKAPQPCTSPFKKKYKYGKHRVVITATSPAGIVETSPVTVTFKIKRPR